MDFIERTAVFIARRHCLVFWVSLLLSLLFGFGGVALMLNKSFGQGIIFAPQARAAPPTAPPTARATAAPRIQPTRPTSTRPERI